MSDRYVVKFECRDIQTGRNASVSVGFDTLEAAHEIYRRSAANHFAKAAILSLSEMSDE